MSNDNVAVVERVFELFEDGDIPGIVALQAEDTVWDHSGPAGNPLNKVFKGHDGVREFYEILGSTQEVSKFEYDECFAAGARVVALGSMGFRVVETGKEWESDFAMVFTLEDGLITHWRPIFDMTAEADAFQA